ncbi:uncharacterized protein LOC123265874 [Cotesia glomerata]|uniref:Uncharacterized protein n=1 Tax=Cotesia glomerata TaxID=32391 RepID=A0AAV7J285_COTGL|nr:uncharacterized protein LOC123265874 [Cotesia glomerata]KAH0561431.1 hypothetical protein KQX54_016742 [Cotesia glomerata]
MEKILNHRDRYICSVPSSEVVKEKFNDLLAQLDKLNRQSYDQLAQDAEKIQNQKDKITDLKKKLLIGEKNKKSFEKELLSQAELLEELNTEKTHIIVENIEIESRKNQIKPKKNTSNDDQIFERERIKLKYYRMLTNIKWDYQDVRTSIRGLITNRKDYTQKFYYDNDDEKVEEKLWKEIEKCADFDLKKDSPPH